MIYCETFLNLESFTARSTELKNLLFDQYKKFFVTGYVPPKISNKKGIDKKADRKFVQFTTAVAETLSKQQRSRHSGVTLSITVIRTRFILDWYNAYGDTFPFRLFEHQRQLLQEGCLKHTIIGYSDPQPISELPDMATIPPRRFRCFSYLH